MAKTKAQKARARAKRVAQKVTKKAQNKQPKRRAKVKAKAKAMPNTRRARGRAPRQNAAYLRARGSTTLASDGLNAMRVVHNGSQIEDTFAVRREKVANVIGTTNTTLSVVQALYLNPGNTVLFPIFSQIAATYEKFRVNTLVFSYETEAYTASGTNVSAGKVILATNYDPSDSQFATDSQMENYCNSDRGAPFCEIVHDVMLGDHALKEEPLKCYFVNSAANTAAPANDSNSSKFFDLGLFQLGVQGNASSSAEIGELYVTYSFTMINPKQQTPLGQNLLAAHYTFTPVTATNTFGTPVQRAGSTLNLVFSGNNAFSFPALGRYNITIVGYATTSWTQNIGGSFVLGAGCSTVLAFNNSTATSTQAGSGATVYSFTVVVDVNTLTAATFGTGVSPTIVGTPTCDLFIEQVPSGLSLLSDEDQKLEKKCSDLEERLVRMERLLQCIDCKSSDFRVDEPSSDEDEIHVEPPVDLSQSETNLLGRVLNKLSIAAPPPGFHGPPKHKPL